MKVINLDDIKHGIRVANMAVFIGKILELDKKTLDSLYTACLFHDIGKAHIEQSVLNKKNELNTEERNQIKQHSFFSYKEMRSLGYSPDVTNIILHHHENYDGTGYPYGLCKEDIPFEARILKIVDVFDALTMNRPYRKKLSQKAAINIMNKEKQHYDPQIYKIFLAALSFRHKKLRDKTRHYLLTNSEVDDFLTVLGNFYYHQLPLVVPEDFKLIKEFADNFTDISDIHQYFLEICN